MSITRQIYRVVRSILFTAVLAVGVLFVGLYVFLQFPPVQQAIKNKAQSELSGFIGGRVNIGDVSIHPFKELVLNDVGIDTPDGEKCVRIDKLGAGLDLWSLIAGRKIIITYVELIGLDASVSQAASDEPLNISFLIDAFAPKEKKKEPAAFDLALKNVVIRKSSVSFDKEWIPRNASRRFDPNHIRIRDLRADLAFPRLSDRQIEVDLRRLAFREECGLEVRGLSFTSMISPKRISINSPHFQIGSAGIDISDIMLDINGYSDILPSLVHDSRSVEITIDRLIPSEFDAFYPKLVAVHTPVSAEISATGNLDRLFLERLRVRKMTGEPILEMRANARTPHKVSEAYYELEGLELNADRSMLQEVIAMIPGLPEGIPEKIALLGDISLKAGGKADMRTGTGKTVVELKSQSGNIVLSGEGTWNGTRPERIMAEGKIENVSLGEILGNDMLGALEGEFTTDLKFDGNIPTGTADVSLPYVDFRGNRIEDITINIDNINGSIEGNLAVDDEIVGLSADFFASPKGDKSRWIVDAQVEHLIPSHLGVFPKYKGYVLSGRVVADATGNSPESLAGTVSLEDFRFGGDKGNAIKVDRFRAALTSHEGEKELTVDSHFISARAVGSVKPLSVDFNISLLPDDNIYSFFNIPARPLQAVDITGDFDITSGSGNLSAKAPYLLKGKDKLIKNTVIEGEISGFDGMSLMAETDFPVKNNRMRISLNFDGELNPELSSGSLYPKAYIPSIDGAISWTMANNPSDRGEVSLNLHTTRDLLTSSRIYALNIGKSGFMINGERWDVDEAGVRIDRNVIDVNRIHISNGAQYVDINGKVSADPMDMLVADLAGVDLSFIFDTLDINYVTFGGMATGRAIGSGLLGKDMTARTEGLKVDNFSYNGAVLGNADLKARWDMDNKMLGIEAYVTEGDIASLRAEGGVYLGCDSLSFRFVPDHVNAALIQPFLENITSSVTGRASGDMQLYGSFKDITLTGYAVAEPVNMKIDYTNVTYTARDSVIFTSDAIRLPNMRVCDKYGNSGNLSGIVNHRCFHDASFSFDLSDADGLLGYDTNAAMNPVWYGRIFVDGGGSLRGMPGLVSLNLNVSTAPGSVFTFVLDNTQTAIDYPFLTFSDKRKALQDSIKAPTIDDRFRKDVVADESSSVFILDIGASVSPDAKVIIVMDPDAGDKITASGNGGLRMQYYSEDDELKLFGKYQIEEGNYNFSLQDLFLRDFKISRGSSISFNGDPMGGLLDIIAKYKVNTNLSDLDKSFSSDPDLKRSTVPVDALLKVNGPFTHPDIGYDIVFPTLTQEVERKVRSIISSEDMLTRQVIYLLALNRFYTPEYAGSSGGGEFASVASSTLSSQLSNLIGQITDKVSLSPSFKADRSDFSDMEVDLALSSRLLDNRLLINGNFGYRDRSTSQTTFIGDFDIEYLLNPDGKLRLKAYNHFNDASYYLKSALTTQGIGIIYRKDFDDPFAFLRRKKKTNAQTEHTKKDSVPDQH